MTDERKDGTDRARRRLLKMGAYLPAGIVALSASRAHAGRAEITAAIKSKAAAGLGVKVKVG